MPVPGGALPVVVFIEDNVVHDVMEGVAGEVNKFEGLFHVR